MQAAYDCLQLETTGITSLSCLAGSQRKAQESTCNCPQTTSSDVSTVLAEKTLIAIKRWFVIIDSPCHTQLPLISPPCLTLLVLLKRLKRRRNLANSDGTIRRWLSLRQQRKCQQKRSEKRPKQIMKRSNQQQQDGRI